MYHMTTTVLSTLLAATLTGCEKYELDRQMEALCKKDGGVRVYESVKLSASEFDQRGTKRLHYAESKTNREGLLGPDYRFVERFETVAGSRGNEWRGHLDRYVIQVIRRLDGKLLGESVAYSRVGGDGITTIVHWQPSSSTCPHVEVDLVNSIFMKGE